MNSNDLPQTQATEVCGRKLYRPDEVVQLNIASKDTLARWRMNREKIPFIKVGSKVLYRGQDILDWLAANTIQPEN